MNEVRKTLIWRWLLVTAGCVVLVGFFVLVRWALNQPLDQKTKPVMRSPDTEIASGMSIRFRHLHADSMSFRSCQVKRRRMGAFVLGAFRVLELEDVVLNLPFPSEMGGTTSSEKPSDGVKPSSSPALQRGRLDKVLERIGLSGIGRFSGVIIRGLKVGRMTETGAEPLFTAEKAEIKGTSLRFSKCQVFRDGKQESVPEAALDRKDGMRLVWQGGCLELPELLEAER